MRATETEGKISCLLFAMPSEALPIMCVDSRTKKLAGRHDEVWLGRGYEQDAGQPCSRLLSIKTRRMVGLSTAHLATENALAVHLRQKKTAIYGS